MTSTLQIFLNYRRDDSSGYAGHLFDDLTQRFGQERVFRDIDGIAPGVDFEDEIERVVCSADVFLALIGPNWLNAVDSNGVRRLDKPDDLVRLEIEAALRPDVRLIPVLVNNAAMPGPEALPPSLKPLTRRNAFEIRDRSWPHDVGELIQALETVEREKLEQERPEQDKPEQDKPEQDKPEREKLEQDKPRERPGRKPPARRRPVVVVSAALLLVATVVFAVVRFHGGDPTPTWTLRAALPAAVRSKCPSSTQLQVPGNLDPLTKNGVPLAHFTTSFACAAPAPGIRYVQYSVTESPDDLQRYFDSRANGVGQSTSTSGGTCGKTVEAVNSWKPTGTMSHELRPSRDGHRLPSLVYRVLCYEKSLSRIEWEDPPQGVYGYVTGPNRATLFEWWTTEAGPERVCVALTNGCPR